MSTDTEITNTSVPETPLGITSTARGYRQISYAEALDKRMVQTHDKYGLSLSFGNRQARRNVIKNRGTGGKPKQYHKQGH